MLTVYQNFSLTNSTNFKEGTFQWNKHKKDQFMIRFGIRHKYVIKNLVFWPNQKQSNILRNVFLPKIEILKTQLAVVKHEEFVFLYCHNFKRKIN